MHPKRRSGRIAKEIAIVLLGTETTGKVFSEETKTVVLSRHGAGVLSRYRFAPDEVLTLRMPDSNKEAEIRLVGQIGGEPGRYVYGVAFVDSNLHFWPMEFPPPESPESLSSFVTLECSLCQARQNIEQHEIEEDVFSVNGNVLRYCADCGTSTPWKKAAGGTVPAPAAVQPTSSFESVKTASKPSFRSAPPIPPPSPAPARPSSRAPISAPLPSAYSGASAIREFASLADIQVSTAGASATAVLQAPELGTAAPQNASPAARAQDVPAPARLLDASGRRVNRRKHMRVRVNFSACVRHPAHADEIVECENVSKGGLCFHSRRQYSVDALIEVAAPFSPGEPALFVPAQIKRVEALSGSQVFRYGAAYVKTTSAGHSS